MILPKKAPDEDIVIEFVFSDRIEPGDTIGSIVSVSASACVGHDENAADVLNGSAEISADSLSVFVPVKGGLMGIHYLFMVEILDSTNEKRVMYGQLPIGIAP